MNALKSGMLVLIGIALGTIASPITAPLLHNIVAEKPPMLAFMGNRVPEMKISLPATHQPGESQILIWKSIIPPHQDSSSDLPLHRHHYSRMLIPLTDGTLTRKDADGAITHYVLAKGKPLFLPEDRQDGFHTDENEGDTTIEVNVIQFNHSDKVHAEKLTQQDLETAVQR